MKQTRTITHADHTDTETLINGVWAVTACDVKLETKEVIIMNIPIELANARTARLSAWQAYDKALEDNKPREYIKEVVTLVDRLDKLCADLYNEWQAKGGTSDIVSLHPVDEAQAIEQVIDAQLDGTNGETVSGFIALAEAHNRHAAVNDYDATITPSDMPVIDFDKVKEVRF